MTFMTCATFASIRRLFIMASSALSRFAKARARSTPPASGYNRQVLQIQLLKMLNQDRRGKQVIDRNAEESLYLRRVQIHCQKPIGTGGDQQIRHDLR